MLHYIAIGFSMFIFGGLIGSLAIIFMQITKNPNAEYGDDL